MPLGISERAENISDSPLMLNISKVIVLLLATLSVASSAEARRWRYYNGSADYNRNNDFQERASGIGFAVALERWIRGCKQEASEWKTWPLESVAQIARVDDAQRSALTQTQRTAEKAGEILDSTCPNDSPKPLADKFDMLDHVLEDFAAGLDSIRPSIEAFYSALDDEQKARLVAMYMSQALDQKSDQYRRSAPKYAPTVQQVQICQQWASSLRAWPIRQVEAAMPLSDDQRAALYTLTGSIYRAAAALIASCPTDTSFTPLGQLDSKRMRVEALRQAINIIRPDVVRFTNKLSDEQKARLVATLNGGQMRLQRRRDRDDDD